MTDNPNLIEELLIQGRLSEYLIKSKLGEDLTELWEELKKNRSDNNAE